MHIERYKNILPKAQYLRKNMTAQERKLWYKFLKTYPVRWYKQRIIGPYIADFYCSAARLVVELDGLQHSLPDAKEYDKIREQYINMNNITVIRFQNIDIDCHFENVCHQIDIEIKKCLLKK